MKARVKTSEDARFKLGDEFPIVSVINRDKYGPTLFGIYAPDISVLDDGSCLCFRDRDAHLGGGQWGIIYDEAERG